jgi:hypothetical protein
MRQQINMTHRELEDVAAKATQLSGWLEDKTLQVACRVPIPPHMTVVKSLVMLSGALIFMDGALPDGACWGGSGNGSCWTDD